MMGIIVEIRDKYMVVLDKKGCFKKVKYKEGCKVGQEINLNSYLYNPFVKKFKAVAVFAAILLIFSGGLYTYFSPYSFVTVDINPSIEMVLNRYNKVLEIRALNDDGQKVIKSMDNIKNKKVEAAISDIIDKAEKDNYIKKNQNNEIFITVTIKKESKDLKNLKVFLEEQTIKQLNTVKVTADVSIESVNFEKRVEAEKNKVSTGKLVLFEKLHKLKPDTQIKDIKDKSVKDIIQTINEIANNSKINDNEKKSTINKDSTIIDKEKNNDSNNNIKKREQKKDNIDKTKVNKQLKEKAKENKNEASKNEMEKDKSKPVQKSSNDKIKKEEGKENKSKLENKDKKSETEKDKSKPIQKSLNNEDEKEKVKENKGKLESEDEKNEIEKDKSKPVQKSLNNEDEKEKIKENKGKLENRDKKNEMEKDKSKFVQKSSNDKIKKEVKEHINNSPKDKAESNSKNKTEKNLNNKDKNQHKANTVSKKSK